jgi:hypothetical protein
VWLLDRNTVFEAAVTTPGNIMSRADPGQGPTDTGGVWGAASLGGIDLTGLIHTIDEDAAEVSPFDPIDVDLTADRLRVHVMGTTAAQFLIRLTGVQAAPIGLSKAAAVSLVAADA